MRPPSRSSFFVLAFLAAPTLSLTVGAACSSSSSGGASPADAAVAETGVDAAAADGPKDVVVADVPEPAWDGQVVQPGCTEDGCIHVLTKGETFPQSLIAAAAAQGEVVENGVTVYAITYVSSGAEITGTLMVPDSTPPTGGFGVVVMNQFTSGLAPSCAPSLGQLAIAVASPGALHGFVTVVPDAQSYGPQPYGAYLVGTVAGRAALDAVRAAFHASSMVGVSIARKAVIAGLSEGAHSTMAAAVEMPTYAPKLEIRGFAAAEPPSHFATALQRSAQANDVPIPYDAIRLWSWQHFLQLSGGAVFRAPYDTQGPQAIESDCVYDGSSGAAGTLTNQFPNDSASVLSDEFLGYAKGNTWPADWAAQNTASEEIPVGITLPIVIYEGTDDTTVLPADTQAYVTELQAAGVQVDYRVEQGGTHGTTALSSFTVQQVADADAIQWIKDRLAN